MRNKGWSRALQFLVGFWPLACSVVILPGFRHVLSIPVELRANWIFQITESQGRAEWMSAVERFVMAYAIAPIYLIAVSGFGVRVRLGDGAPHDRDATGGLAADFRGAVP